jgi:hypothetical protein
MRGGAMNKKRFAYCSRCGAKVEMDVSVVCFIKEGKDWKDIDLFIPVSKLRGFLKKWNKRATDCGERRIACKICGRLDIAPSSILLFNKQTKTDEVVC